MLLEDSFQSFMVVDKGCRDEKDLVSGIEVAGDHPHQPRRKTIFR